MSRFFIDRPVFAWVIALFILVLGAVAITRLPVAQYPSVAPPSIVITAAYPGASAQTLEDSVLSVIEQEMNGSPGIIYIESVSQANGSGSITLSFEPGTNADLAQVDVQNRLSRAAPRLPLAVTQQGVRVDKSRSNFLLFVTLASDKPQYNPVALGDYASRNILPELQRVAGVGQAQLFGTERAMRIWIDPAKLVGFGLTPGDVNNAIHGQNAQVSSGTLGDLPNAPGQTISATVVVAGQLTTVEQFEAIVLRAASDGSSVRLKDVARIEIGGQNYGTSARLNGSPSTGIGVQLSPTGNALATATAIRVRMEELSRYLPPGVKYAIPYDSSRFVRISISQVVETLFIAVALVFLVMYLFLQNLRYTIIPTIVVPVALLGTFAVMLVAGFSINVLTMFGMVLAIGILVDDAIVVVENVERNIEAGLDPRDAAVKAMHEVSGPIVAIGLVLCAVFIPLAFVSGLEGQFYRQFAVTIAISTVISAFNSLTLSPALAAVLLRPHNAPKDRLTRVMDAMFGGFFRWFNRFFKRNAERYSGGITGLVARRKSVTMIVYALLLGAAVLLFLRVPPGFVPQQDKQYLIGIAQLPEGASLQRTTEVIRRLSDIALSVPGIKDSVAFPGLSINGFTAAPNSGIVFFGLDEFDKRLTPETSADGIVGQVNMRLGAIQDAFLFVLSPPPVNGLGNSNGFKLQLQDRESQGETALQGAVQQLMGRVYGNPNGGITQFFSSYQINVPQLFSNVDRTRAKQMGVNLNDVYETMQTYLGSLYVNDFNLFGKTYQVIVQADAGFRAKAEDIGNLKVRNSRGQMVALNSIMSVEPTFGPGSVTRYNGFYSADINGAPKPGVSSGQAQAEMEKILRETLPRGIGYEWTELVYQEKIAGNTMAYIFPLCVLLVFLVLAATYESWTLPLAIILIVPMCILSAMFGVWISGLLGAPGDNNVFTKVALVVLVGLACKNAILIIEFAKALEDRGETLMHAVVHACRMRLRPILMTSIAFIAGVIPLMLSTGAGAEMRRAMGIAVFSGMLGVTLFGLFLTPVFYVLMRKSTEKRRIAAAHAASRAMQGDDHA